VVNILGQRNTIAKDVVVEGPQRAAPNASYSQDSADNITFTFMDTSTSTNGNITERYWDLGDGTHVAYEPEVTHTYGWAGTYIVRLEVVDELGYRDSYEQTITTEQAPLASPEANFTEYIGDGSYSADFYDTSTSVNGEITEWYWDLGDGTHAGGEPNINHTYAYSGNYTVKLEVVDEYGARAVVEREFFILGESRGPAEAYFTFYNDVETGNVTFYDNSSSPNGVVTERYWDLGDGTFITGETLFDHAYEPGIYTVTLEVVDLIGERDTYEVSFQII
jgi:PKD repeat protein